MVSDITSRPSMSIDPARAAGGSRHRRAMESVAGAERRRQPYWCEAGTHRVRRHLRGDGGMARNAAPQPVVLAVNRARPEIH